MRYVTVEACHLAVFPFIYKYFTAKEPVPLYESNVVGLGNLKKVLDLIQNDEYYPEIIDKASYLTCSIAGSQYFDNGNKRLAVTTLLIFIMINDVEILKLSKDEMESLLVKKFAKYVWEGNSAIQDPHALFLYNLATVIGDRKFWNSDNFSILKEDVSDLFKEIYKFE